MKTITIDNQTYKLPAPNEGGKLQQEVNAYAKRAERIDPVADVAKAVKDLPPDVQIALIEKAMARKYDAKTPEQQQAEMQSRWLDYASTSEGIETFLTFIWQRYQPNLTIDQIWELHAKATDQYGPEYFLQ